LATGEHLVKSQIASLFTPARDRGAKLCGRDPQPRPRTSLPGAVRV